MKFGTNWKLKLCKILSGILLFFCLCSLSLGISWTKDKNSANANSKPNSDPNTNTSDSSNSSNNSSNNSNSNSNSNFSTTCQNHSFKSTITIVQAATCAKEGVGRRDCRLCGYTETVSLPKTTGHTYNAYTVVRQATCIAEGQKQRTCTICGDMQTAPIPKGDHNYGSYAVVEEASCTNMGRKERVCSVCGDVQGEDIPQLTHLDLSVGNYCSSCQYRLIIKDNKTLFLANADTTIVEYYDEINSCSVSDSLKNAVTEVRILTKNPKAIGSSAFKNFSSLQNIKIPDNVQNIGSYAFYKCNNL